MVWEKLGELILRELDSWFVLGIGWDYGNIFEWELSRSKLYQISNKKMSTLICVGKFAKKNIVGIWWVIFALLLFLHKLEERTSKTEAACNLPEANTWMPLFLRWSCYHLFSSSDTLFTVIYALFSMDLLVNLHACLCILADIFQKEKNWGHFVQQHYSSNSYWWEALLSNFTRIQNT